MNNELMGTLKQPAVDQFNQYQSLKTEEERQKFWNAIEVQSDKMTVEQRSAAQMDIRENVKQILQRMEKIAEQSTVTEHKVVS